MIKIDNHYFLDFTEELLPGVVSMHFLAPKHVIAKELLCIYQTYLIEEKEIEFASPCIVSIDVNGSLAKYLEKLNHESKLDLNRNPFDYRKDNYILLNWSLIKKPMIR